MATPQTIAAAKSAYRNALRATKIAFKQDIPVLTESRLQIKQGFKNHQTLNNTEQIEAEITKINDITKFLIQNIVQGEKQDDGKYHLNFHDKTELGDNETIKQGKKADLGSLAGAKGTKVKKCSEK